MGTVRKCGGEWKLRICEAEWPGLGKAPHDRKSSLPGQYLSLSDLGPWVWQAIG